jgi:AcrR family transcriptional regulator
MTIEEKILRGAQELVFRYGIKSITMDDIAKHLGMSKKTIYLHYDDKDQLILKLVEFLLGHNEDKMGCIIDQSKDPIHEIIETMKMMSSTFAKMNPILFHDMMKYYPESYQKFKEFKENRILKMIENNLKKGQELNLYRVDINLKILARLRLEELDLAINFEAFPPEKYNLADVQVQLLDHFLHGVCTLKGHKILNKYKELHEEE